MNIYSYDETVKTESSAGVGWRFLHRKPGPTAASLGEAGIQGGAGDAVAGLAGIGIGEDSAGLWLVAGSGRRASLAASFEARAGICGGRAGCTEFTCDQDHGWERAARGCCSRLWQVARGNWQRGGRRHDLDRMRG